MQVRINGKIGVLGDVYHMLKESITTREEKYQLDGWYRETQSAFEKGNETVKVNRFGHPEILIDTYIGTDEEYAIHWELLKLQGYSQKLDSKAYNEQEKKVNKLLRRWAYEI